MAADKVTFTDKVQGRDLPEVPVTQKMRFEDANELKNVANIHADNLDELAVDWVGGLIEKVSDREYKIVLNCPIDGTINSTTTICTTGTATATFSINGTDLGGTANSVSITEEEQAHASANSFAVGDDIEVTISSNASCENFSFTIEFTKTLSNI